MEEKITQIFRSIGLSKNEIKVYLDLIRNNSSCALAISKRLGIHRPNAYDALNGLIEKGFVQVTIKDNKRIFYAISPNKIKDYLMQKKQELDSIIPDLIEFSERKDNQEEVSITKGIFALRNAIMSLLEESKTINVYGIPLGSEEILGKGFLDDFHDTRIKKKILMRHIYSA